MVSVTRPHPEFSAVINTARVIVTSEADQVFTHAHHVT